MGLTSTYTRASAPVVQGYYGCNGPSLICPGMELFYIQRSWMGLCLWNINALQESQESLVWASRVGALMDLSISSTMSQGTGNSTMLRPKHKNTAKFACKDLKRLTLQLQNSTLEGSNYLFLNKIYFCILVSLPWPSQLCGETSI